MIKRVIGYLGVVLFSIYLFFVYDGNIWTAVLFLECIYPLLSALFLKSMTKRVTVEFGLMPAMGEKGKTYEQEILVENTSRVWGLKYRVRMETRYRFSQKANVRKLAGTLLAGEKASVLATLSFPYSGSLEAELKSVIIYDLFGIFYRKIPLKEKRTVGIMPAFDLIPVEVTRRTREFIADADEYSTEKSGDDPSEIYQVREYRQEDSVSLIHWKLSAKEDKLMVKENGFPLGSSVLLWVRLPKQQISPEQFGKLMEQASALSITLFEENVIHTAAWYEEKNGRVVKWRIDSEEAVYDWIWHLLSYEPFQEEETEMSCYKEAFRGEAFSSVVVLDGGGGFQVNGEKQEIPEI